MVKNKGKKLFYIIMASLLTVTSTGCTPERGEEISYDPPSFTTYQNNIEIDGQWGACSGTRPESANGEYGIGDPFVMKFNGKYYLYPSSGNGLGGIKVYVSDDMVNWEYKGYCVSETAHGCVGAYAPEVVYYKGYFYLCQSRGGNGHYIYRAENPLGPFELVSNSMGISENMLNYGNIGLGIDGAFHLSDNGNLYIMHTTNVTGLAFNKFNDIDNINTSTITSNTEMGEANLQHWIEGPGLIRRGDYTYFTYTGNHVISRGYRIAYSYAKNLKDLQEYQDNGDEIFIQPVENIVMIDTKDEHYGLGHSSNFNGPDLDSIYTAYHDLVGSGPARRYNLDRFYAFGGYLSANGVTCRPVAMPSKPSRCINEGNELSKTGDYYSLGSSSDYFTAEYNFIPMQNQGLVFGANNQNAYVIKLTATGIALYKRSSLGDTLIQSADTFYNLDKINTIRVENGDGLGYIYINGMRVITYQATASAGIIGYLNKEGVYYTAFTNDVFGTSDFESIKNFPTKFPAVSYLKGENRGFSFSNASVVKGGVRVGEKQSITQIGDNYAVKLNNEDWVKYGVDIGNDGYYTLGATVKSGTEATLEITIGDSKIITEIDGDVVKDSETVNVTLGRIYLTKGVKSMKVKLIKGNAEIVAFQSVEDAGIPVTDGGNNVNLNSFTKKNGNVSYSNGILSVYPSSLSGVAVWGNEGISDFKTTIEFSAEIKSDSRLGFMLRAKNYSYFSSQVVSSWQGYFLQFTGVNVMKIDRYDYCCDLLGAKLLQNNVGDGEKHILEVTVKNNMITAILDGEGALTVSDDHALLSGQLGVYVSSGKIDIYSIKYQILP